MLMGASPEQNAMPEEQALLSRDCRMLESAGMKSYYNTTLEQFAEREQYERKANAQEALILTHTQKNPGAQFSTESIRPLFPRSVPTTSIRRAICNLKAAGALEIVGKTTGEYGRSIFLYRRVV